MHLFLRKPNRATIESLIQRYADDPVTHPDVGSTRLWQPKMFHSQPDARTEGEFLIQMRRLDLGQGEQVFGGAQELLRHGKCFDLDWVDLVSRGELQVGDTFCVLARAYGVWAANFCRVTYLERSRGGPEQLLSLGIGTLPRHAAVGEERIAVSWNASTDEVDFLIGSISRPQHWLVRLMKRFLRRQQQRFAVEAGGRLRGELASPRGPRPAATKPTLDAVEAGPGESAS